MATHRANWRCPAVPVAECIGTNVGVLDAGVRAFANNQLHEPGAGGLVNSRELLLLNVEFPEAMEDTFRQRSRTHDHHAFIHLPVHP